MPKSVMKEKIYTRRKRGRPKVRWLDDVHEDLREIEIEGWRREAQDRPVEASSTGGQGSRRAVAPNDNDDDDLRFLGKYSAGCTPATHYQILFTSYHRTKNITRQ